MVEEGVMQGVDGVIGLHLISNQPVGRVGVREGSVFASADSFTLTVCGRGGHAAMPNQAVDPVVISAQIITALQTLVSRETSPFGPAVVTIASMHAGTAFNIIPEQAVLQGTMRAYTPMHRAYLQRRLIEMTSGIAQAMGGSCVLDFEDGCPACVNDPAMTELVYRAAVAAVGKDAVDTGEEVLISGSDDMAYFLQAAPGCYFIVGAHNRSKGAAYAHHHPRFNIDEDALPIAVEVLTRAALDFCETGI
jgi:amidohydrolase